MAYCNTTTDLLRAYPKVMDGFRAQKILKGYLPHTTANIFKLGHTGYVEAMYEDNLVMTAAVNLAAVDAAREYFWDSTTDILYFYPTGGVPDNHSYKIGETMATVLSDCVAIASRDADALLDKKYTVPLPMSPDGSTTQPYDRDFTNAVAQLACAHIISRVSPIEFFVSGEVREGNVAGSLMLQGTRLITEYVEGTRVFSWEVTQDEVGGVNIRATSTNTSGGMIQTRGRYDPEIRPASSVFDGEISTVLLNDPFWKIKITLAGFLGTATFDLSTNNGTTYAGANAVTSNLWTHLTAGIWIRFLPFTSASTFILNDTWQLEVTGPNRDVTSARVRSVRNQVV